MSDYIQENLNKIIQGNAYELIKAVPDRSIDLIVTDPPYDFNQTYKSISSNFDGGRKLSYAKIENTKAAAGFDYAILDEFKRVLKKMNLYVWIGKNSLPKICRWMEDNDYLFEVLFWHKINPIPLINNKYLSDYEMCIFVREKGQVLYGSYDNLHRVFTSNKNLNDRAQYSHPTIKPTWIIEQHILASSQPAHLILDPFMGSGTTAVAARNLKRRFIGFELDEAYCKIANDRLAGISVPERQAEEQGQGLQARLFDDE